MQNLKNHPSIKKRINILWRRLCEFMFFLENYLRCKNTGGLFTVINNSLLVKIAWHYTRLPGFYYTNVMFAWRECLLQQGRLASNNLPKICLFLFRRIREPKTTYNVNIFIHPLFLSNPTPDIKIQMQSAFYISQYGKQCFYYSSQCKRFESCRKHIFIIELNFSRLSIVINDFIRLRFYGVTDLLANTSFLVL